MEFVDCAASFRIVRFLLPAHSLIDRVLSSAELNGITLDFVRSSS
jgi:hypothetical protein